MSYQSLSYFASENGNENNVKQEDQFATSLGGTGNGPYSISQNKENWVALETGSYEGNTNGPSQAGPTWGPKNAVVSPVTMAKKMRAKYKSSSSSKNMMIWGVVVLVVVLLIVMYMHHKKSAKMMYYF